MKGFQVVKGFLMTRRYEKGYQKLQEAITELAKVRQVLHSFHAEDRQNLGHFPECLEESLKYLEVSLQILHSYRPIRTLTDALDKIKEIAEQEKAAEEKRKQIKKLIRK